MRTTSSNIFSMMAVAAVALLTTACSVDGQITDTTKRTVKATSSQLTGISAGSGQTITTSNGYKVSSSVGSQYGGDIVTTTSSGYKVYSSLQGNLNAETFQTIVE